MSSPVIGGAVVLFAIGCPGVQNPVSAGRQACQNLGFGDDAIDDLFATAEDLPVVDDASLETALDDLDQECVDGCTEAGCMVNCRSCSASILDELF